MAHEVPEVLVHSLTTAESVPLDGQPAGLRYSENPHLVHGSTQLVFLLQLYALADI